MRINFKRMLEQAPSFLTRLGRGWLVHGSPSLQGKVRRGGIGLVLQFDAAGRENDQFQSQHAGDPAGYVILQFQIVAARTIEAVRPDMATSFCIDQLRVDSNLIAGALHATFEREADTEFTPNLAGIDRLALVGERRVARDNEAALNSREICCQA